MEINIGNRTNTAWWNHIFSTCTEIVVADTDAATDANVNNATKTHNTNKHLNECTNAYPMFAQSDQWFPTINVLSLVGVVVVQSKNELQFGR